MTLNLDPRQRAMLAEMGVRLWAPRAGNALDSEAAGARPASARGQSGIEAPAAPVAPAAAPAPAPARTRAPAPEAAPGSHAPLLVPRPEGVEAMDWRQLEAAVAGCRACALCATRTQTVFGVGARQADWMVVGEAPGETEDQRGEPFVGPAGQLLDAMLAAIGLSRQAGNAMNNIAVGVDSTRTCGQKDQETASKDQKKGVYIANLLKCRPPANRNPQPDEIAQCEPYLRRQVALVQPRIILAMGRFAVQSLLNTDEPIGRLRGRAHHYQGVPVIVTYHPAYLLRAPHDKAKAWADLCLALQVREGGQPS